MKYLILAVAIAATNAQANPLEGENPGLSLANMIAMGVISFCCGWMAYKVAEATKRCTPETEALIAAVAGLFIGPLVAVLLLR